MTTRKPARNQVAYRKPAGDGAKNSSTLTSERISDDLETFRKSGGRIEVLGNTRVLTRIDETGKK